MKTDFAYSRVRRLSDTMGFCLMLMVFVFSAGCAATEPPEVTIASNGTPQLDIIVGGEADEDVRSAAGSLADYLGRISGGKFKVVAGDGREGIAVGRCEEFPALGLQNEFDIEGIAGREQYILRSHRKGLFVVGRTEIGLENAVWDLLHRLGYRQYFPGETWEIIPHEPDLTISVDANESPDYYSRKIRYSYGTWGFNRKDYTQWLRRNRIRRGFALNSGHAYGGIIRANKEEFDSHPEYFALIDGERRQRRNAKFCISNAGLRDLVAEWAVKRFKENPGLDSVSVDPSDGGGWCECEKCKALGNISDRALLLANTVARRVVSEVGKNKYVGMYAYNYHSPPPLKHRVHPNVIISVATAFLKGGMSVDEIIQGWKEAGAELFGIREYFSIIHWDKDLPGAARASHPKALAQKMARFHKMGARFVDAESSENFGPSGIGYYVASRVFWDTSEAERVEEIKEEFLRKAFGSAHDSMRKYYGLIVSPPQRPVLSDDLVGRMYRHLAAALETAKSPDVKERIRHLVLYTRYVDLYVDYKRARGRKRQGIYERLIRHAYRIRRTMMVHSKAIYRTGLRDRSVKIPENAHWQVPPEKNPWKIEEPYPVEQIYKMLKTGVNEHQLLDFEPVQYSEKLVPAMRLKLRDVKTVLPPARRSRGRRTYYTWVDEAPHTFHLKLVDGLIKHYRDRGDATIRLRPAGGEIVAEHNIPPDGKVRDVPLRASHTGLHVIELSDGMDSSRLEWESGTPMTLRLDFGPRYDSGKQILYFYVPRGLGIIGGYHQWTKGTIVGPAGKTAHEFDGGMGYFQVPVPEGQDGKLWRFEGRFYKAKLMLMNVPPYMARNAEELLLPREVVEADAPE
ncbi:MAG: DUF4838 domain-containing protein [Planctomycetes bacterium]|nr:DUF4838 domain-containing protein [Planctomycetota bacterium]